MSAPWPVVRLTLRADLAGDFRAWCGEHGVDPADALELLVTSLDGNHPERAAAAADVLARFAAGEARGVYELGTPAEADVALMRMGPVIAETPATGDPYRRDHRGADLTDDAVRCWNAGRGYWIFSSKQSRPDYVTITRLGVVLHVYRTDSWEPINSTPTRYWATGGWLIDPHTRQLQPVDRQARRRKVPAVTTRDLAVLDAVKGQLVTYPADKASASVLRLNSTSAASREYQSEWRARRATGRLPGGTADARPRSAGPPRFSSDTESATRNLR